MKLTVIGCSPAWPNPGGAHSGYLVESGGRRLLLDCGPGVLARLRERETWPALDAIVVTHFHLDHWGDLVPWVWGTMFSPAASVPQAELWVHRGGSARLADLGERLGRPDMFSATFVVREYGERERFSAAGFDVTPFRVPHYTLETYALRVEAEGRTLTYSGDSAPTDALAEAARDADLFLCEATLPDSGEDDSDRGHLSAPEAVAAAEAAAARRLVIVHRPAELDLDPSLERAYDGLELSV